MTPVDYTAAGLLILTAGTAAALADRYLAPSPLADPAGSVPTPGKTQAAGHDEPPVARSTRRSILLGGAAVAMSALITVRVGWTASLPACCCVAAAAAPLTASDVTEHRLPDRITVPAIAITLTLLAAASWQAHDSRALVRAVLAAALSAGFFLVIALITRALGAGDIKLAALTGLPLGWLGWDHLILAVLAGMTLAAITAVTLVVAHRISRRDPIPLGPFLLAGALLGMLI